MPEPTWDRLHGATVLIEFLRVLWRLATAIAILVVFSLMGERSNDRTEVLLSAVGMYAVVAAFVRRATFRFAVADGNLILKSGVFVRSERTIPLERIQNLNLRQTWIHQVLGVVDVQVETAGGIGVEAELSTLGKDRAESLRSELLAGPVKSGEDSPILERPPLYRASSGDLLIAGATQNRALAIVGAVSGVGWIAGGGIWQNLAGTLSVGGFAVGAILILGLLVFGWILSIAHTVVTYFGFELRHESGRLRRRYGLLNRIDNEVPLGRVQTVRWSASPVQRWLERGRLDVQTAGSFVRAEQAGTSVLAPLMPASHRREVLSATLAYPNPDALPWHPLHPKAAARRFRSSLVWLVLLAGFSAVYLQVWGLAVLGGLLVYSAVLSRLSARRSSYAVAEEMLAVASGVWTRQRTWLPAGKVQSVSLRQSPLERRLGLMRVIAQTAREPVEVPDLKESDARALAETLRVWAAEKSRSVGDAV